MTQALYAHMNNKRKMKKKRRIGKKKKEKKTSFLLVQAQLIALPKDKESFPHLGGLPVNQVSS
jgi:hypothetical protein